jgi:hypothetical protein
MATELLYNAVKTYIEPLLNFGSIYINGTGQIVEREHGRQLYFINDNYKGLPGEVPNIYPVLPVSDAHYLEVRETKGLEVFNPLLSIKHMEFVVAEFIRGMLEYCISDEKYNSLPLEQLEDLIKFYYSKVPGGSMIAGFSNVEDPANPADIFTYLAATPLEAMWGLCVTAYNKLDRRHNELFYEPEKSWKRAMRLANKWENERRNIALPHKEGRQEDAGFNNIDFTQEANFKVREFGRSYYVDEGDMDNFLFNLFTPGELVPCGPGVFARPLRRTEKKPVFPDFANEELLFAKAVKGKKGSRPGHEEEETAEFEIISGGDGKNEAQIIENSVAEAGPSSGKEELPAEAVPENEAVPVQDNIPSLPPARPQSPPPVYPGPVPPFNPAMGPPGYGPVPPFNPMMGPPGYGPPPFAGTGWGGMGFPPPGYGPPPYPVNPGFYPQGVPTGLDQIDFVSKDRPDPLASYKNNDW